MKRNVNGYNGYYRSRGNKNGILYETTVEAENREEAVKYLREDLGNKRTLIKVLKIWY